MQQTIEQAVEAHRAGNLQEAEALYRAILKDQPQHPDANHNLGVLAVSADNSAAALPLLRAALEANPKQGQYWLSYINALINDNQPETARLVLGQGKKMGLAGEKVDELSRRLAPLSEESESDKAQSSTFTQQHKKFSAKKEKKKNASPSQRSMGQTSSPSQAEVKALSAQYQSGEYAVAEKLALGMTQNHPNHQFGWKVLGAVFSVTGRTTDAVVANQKAVALVPNDAEAHSNLGNALKDLSRLEEAEASYRQAIALKPDFAQAHSNLGNALKDLSRLEEAEASYRQAIALKPDFAQAHSNLGNALKDLSRLEEAEASYRKAIALKSDFVEARNNLGVTLQDLGRLEDAQASYRQAITFKPDFVEAHYNLGNALGDLGRLEDAQASYRQAITFKPDFVEAHYNLGNALKDLDRLEEAEASLRQAVALKPNFAEAHNNLGNALRDLGRLKEAEASYRQANALKPDFAQVHSNLGFVFQDQGRIDESEASYRRMLEVSPDSNRSLGTIPTTALVCHGRSGSKFFHSLIDGHPEIATLPGIYFKGWFGVDRWKFFSPDLTNINWRDVLVAKILQEYEPQFDARSRKNVHGKPYKNAAWLARALGLMEMGPDRSQHFQVDREAFSTTLLSLLRPLSSVTQQACFELIHQAFEMSIRGNVAWGNHGRRHIFYHLHNPDPFERANFLQLNPKARLLHIVRNPIQNMESWLMHYWRANISDGLEHHSQVNNWRDMASRIATLLREFHSPVNRDSPHRGVRLEDIKSSPKRVMPQIANWMGVSDHPALYESSFCGMQYWGGSSASTGKITGFNTEAIDKPLGRIFGKRDIVIFETLFWPFSSLYGYTDMDAPSFQTQLSTIRPWLQEPLEFERKLYEALPERTGKVEDLDPYKRLHLFLNQLWDTLERDGTYHGMPQPLELD